MRLVEKEAKVSRDERLTVRKICDIFGVAPSSYYAKQREKKHPDGAKRRRAAEERRREKIVFKHWSSSNNSVFGFKKMSNYLRNLGFEWATEHVVRRIYKRLGIRGQTPDFKTTRAGKAPYGKFPYLLRGKCIDFANQVMATDITYIKTRHGMRYFTAVIDLYSRKILKWRLDEDMLAENCCAVVKAAFEEYGVPAIFNTDCGSQYTSAKFIELLQENGVRVSQDGVGRCLDNVFVERTWRTLKYEGVFMHDYRDDDELRAGLAEFVRWFNGERPHQSLDYRTPDEVYFEGCFASKKFA